jgi:hypothetical protein
MHASIQPSQHHNSLMQRLLLQALRGTLKRAGLVVVKEEVFVLGTIKTRVLPSGISKADFEQWWPRLSEQERDRYTAYEAHNLITTSGRSQLLTYIGVASLSAGVVPFSQYFSVGTGAIAQVSPGDTGMIGELFRAAPSTYTISGNAVNISTYFGATQANGTYTNCGFFGNNATATLGSGTLVTHALYSYTKTNGQTLTNDYLVQLN